MTLIAFQINYQNPVYIDEKGNKYLGIDELTLQPKQKFRINLEQVNTTFDHAACLLCPKGKIKNLNTNEVVKSWAFHWPGRPVYVDLEMTGRIAKVVEVYQGWDREGYFQADSDTAAMRVEDLENGGRRYYCNAANEIDKFDDFIFSIEPLEGSRLEFKY